MRDVEELAATAAAVEALHGRDSDEAEQAFLALVCACGVDCEGGDADVAEAVRALDHARGG